MSCVSIEFAWLEVGIEEGKQEARISLPPASFPPQGTSSTTATVPRRSIANRHCNRRLHRYANRKLRSSKLFGPSGPSYTPYHMMVESRPL